MTRFKLKILVKKISRHISPNNSFYKFSTHWTIYEVEGTINTRN